VRASARLELVAEPPLNLVCLAHRGGDDATQRLIDAVNRDGRFLVSHCRFHGRLVLRVSVGALATTRAHLAAFTEHLLAEAERA
jgi:aromatic-L-amino-acid decarboxylase